MGPILLITNIKGIIIYANSKTNKINLIVVLFNILCIVGYKDNSLQSLARLELNPSEKRIKMMIQF